MSGILTDKDIVELCKLFKIKLNACVCKDDLKTMKCKNGGYVINLGDSETGGTHWVALYVENKRGCYYDSYGMIYPDEVKAFCKELIYNVKDQQHLTDTHCGYYCMGFLHYMEYNTNNNSILSDELNKYTSIYTCSKTGLRKLQQYYKNKIYI